MTTNGSRQVEVNSSANSALPASRLSLLYVNPLAKARLAGLYGLLATVEQCLYRTSDEQVCRTKLNWWLEELHAAKNHAGTHPLSLQLTSCGALNAWSEYLLKRLFDLALYRIDAAGLGTESELLDLCEAMGIIHLELECALHNQAIPKHPAIKQLTVVNGQIQLMRESFWAKRANFFWVPLTLCAKLDLQRRQINNDSGSISNFHWIPAVAQLTLENAKPTGTGIASLKEESMAWTKDNKHWLIFSFLQQRQLQRLVQSSGRTGPAKNVASQISQVNFADGWASWLFARKLNGGKLQ